MRLRSVTTLGGVALLNVVAWLTLGALGQPGGPLAGAVDAAASFSTTFLGIFIEAAPFLLLGTLASGLVEAFISPDSLRRFIPHGAVRGAVTGAFLGLCFPVCECGVVPLTRRLMQKGLQVPAGVAFLLAAPVMNPIVIASTVAAFGFGPVLYLRLGLTVVIAVATALVFAWQRQPLLQPVSIAPVNRVSGDEPAIAAQAAPWRTGLARALTIAVDEFFDMGRFLVAGALLAALMQTIIPRSALLAVSSSQLVSVMALSALAFVLSICSTVDAFIALSFTSTFTTAAVVAFLVFGPMVDIKGTLMFMGVFRRRTVAYLVLVPLVMTVALTTAINGLISR